MSMIRSDNRYESHPKPVQAGERKLSGATFVDYANEAEVIAAIPPEFRPNKYFWVAGQLKQVDNDGTTFRTVGGGGGAGWNLTGNAGTNPVDNFIGTTDDINLEFRVNNVRAGLLQTNANNNNTFLGYGAGYDLTAGHGNIAIGGSALVQITTGNFNTAVGTNALGNITTGVNNTAIGAGAMNPDKDIQIDSSIMLGRDASANMSFQFALPDEVINIKLRGFNYQMPSSNNNGVLTNTGGVWTWGAGGGGGTTILPNSVAYGDGAGAIISNANFKYISNNLLLGSQTDTGERFQVTGNSLFTGQINNTVNGWLDATFQSTSSTTGSRFHVKNAEGAEIVCVSYGSGVGTPWSNTARLYTSGGTSSLILQTNMEVAISGTTPIIFQTGGSDISNEVMRITATDHAVLIGNTVSTGEKLQVKKTFSSSSSVETLALFEVTSTQSGTGGWAALKVNAIRTTEGTGSRLLADFQIDSQSKFTINRLGTLTLQGTNVSTGTASHTILTIQSELNAQAATMANMYAGLQVLTSINNSSCAIDTAHGCFAQINIGSAFTGSIAHMAMFTANNNLNTSAITVGSWYGFRAPVNPLSTNAYAFRGDLSASANRWNLYMAGTALNHLTGNLLIGSTTETAGTEKLQVTGTSNFTGNMTLAGSRLIINGSNANSKINIIGTQATPAGNSQMINTQVTLSPSAAVGTIDSIMNYMTFQASTFGVTAYNGFTSRVDFHATNYTGTIANLNLYLAWGTSVAGGATISNLRGFYCQDLTSGGFNIGFQSSVSAGTNKWNAYFNGTANNYFLGPTLLGSNSPSAQGEILQVTGASKFSSSVLLGRLTTAQRDALTAANGMIIYNSELNKFQGYENGAWVNLI